METRTGKTGDLTAVQPPVLQKPLLTGIHQATPPHEKSHGGFAGHHNGPISGLNNQQ